MDSDTPNENATATSQPAVTAITVQGFKSLYDETRIELRPLTVLAGRNSSGKSSAIQPLLLLKQTLEARFDPGPLWLGGPNVQFTSADQLLSRISANQKVQEFSLAAELPPAAYLQLTYGTSGAPPTREFSELHGVVAQPATGEKVPIRSGSGNTRAQEAVGRLVREYARRSTRSSIDMTDIVPPGVTITGTRALLANALLFSGLQDWLLSLIHVPGFRGNPERTYGRLETGPRYPGQFQDYVASILHAWQNLHDRRLRRTAEALQDLELTWKLKTELVSGIAIELKVGRTTKSKRGGARDLVNIADVGFGVSQVLPVLVALLVAEPGQPVYIEQPELHLHPEAQLNLAKCLAEAAKRGVQVIVETHSDLLLLGIQTLVAKGELSPELVKLHWFKRQDDGRTTVDSRDLDKRGRFGDWPEDFGEVTMKAQRTYLDAQRTHRDR